MIFLSMLIVVVLILFVVPEIIDSRRLRRHNKALSLIGKEVRFKFNGRELMGRAVMLEHSTQDLWILGEDGKHYLVSLKAIKSNFERGEK